MGFSAEDLMPLGGGDWEAEMSVPLWSAEPVEVRVQLAEAPDGPGPGTVALLTGIEGALPALWPEIQAALLDLTGLREPWQLASRVASLSVNVTEGQPRWAVQAELEGARFAEQSFFVDLEGGRVIGADSVD